MVSDKVSTTPTTVPLVLELFALDTTSCGPCVSALASLHAAAAVLSRELTGRGYAVATRVVRLEDADHARAHGMVSSPTVRVNGVDIVLDIEEHACSSCSDLAGAPVECRTYSWEGQLFDHAPAGLIAAAVHRHVEAGARRAQRSTPVGRGTTSVERFFSARENAGR
jgi:hypothetical protein